MFDPADTPPVGPNHGDGYVGGPPQHQQQHQQHRPMADDRDRKMSRPIQPIGTERQASMMRRTPGPPHTSGGQPVGFSPADLGLWGYHGAPGNEMVGGGGPAVPMNPSTLPPGLTHGDWMNLSGMHPPNVSVPAPNVSDDGGLSYLQQKQPQGMPQPHHHQQQQHHHHHAYLQRQLEGMADDGGESLDMQFAAQSVGGMNGGGPNANQAAFHHPGAAFLNGIPPPGMPGGGPMGPPMFGAEQHGGDAVNGMWIGQGSSNMKGKVGGPSPNPIASEQQLTEPGMVMI